MVCKGMACRNYIVHTSTLTISAVRRMSVVINRDYVSKIVSEAHMSRRQHDFINLIGDKPALVTPDLDLVARHLSRSHSSITGKHPMLNTITPEPLRRFAGRSTILVVELDRYAVFLKREEFFSKSVIVLALPLGLQKDFDLCPTVQESIPIAPGTLLCVRFRTMSISMCHTGWSQYDGTYTVKASLVFHSVWAFLTFSLAEASSKTIGSLSPEFRSLS